MNTNYTADFAAGITPEEDEKAYRSMMRWAKLGVVLSLSLVVLLLACNKQMQTGNCQSLTYVSTVYDHNWKPISSVDAMHWCRVCDTELERFKTYGPDTVCGRFEIMRWVVGPDQCGK